ncbi:MAG: trypsin-like peptidase domain-containing protein [Burkholderiaceae bacterium]|nr:trypsin-like peptidase domain-containing protein [Burkholderiaceae bacterium]
MAGVCTWTAAHAGVDRAAFIDLSTKVLKVEVSRQQGGYSLGSGVLVAPHRMLTNCHVTRDAQEIYTYQYGTRLQAVAQVSDVRRDLCLLFVPGLVGDAVALGRSKSLREGQSVSAIGYTGGIGIQNSPGEVVVLHPFDGGQVIQSTNWFTSGASGGGLFDDDLRLVGVMTFRLRGGEAHYFSAPVEWVQDLLARQDEATEIAPIASQALAFWQQPQSQQPRFLQAAVLERDRRWTDLEQLASGWVAVHEHDAEPWYLRGLALQQQNRLADAKDSLEHCVTMAPLLAVAWHRLGLVYGRLGLLAQAQGVQRRLRDLNPELALQLANSLLPH